MPYSRNNPNQQQQGHSRRANGVNKRRSQHQLHDHNNHQNHQNQQQQPVEFPPLSDDREYDLMHSSSTTTIAHQPPPYSANVDASASELRGTPAGSNAPGTAFPPPMQQQFSSGLQSISPDEYYHPASFPGYAVVQLANGGEGQALLPRITHHRRNDGSQQQSHFGHAGRVQIRRLGSQRSRNCCARCCGWLCSCLCFLLGVALVGLFIAAVLFVSRHAFPPSWEWQCSEGQLQLHTDRQFVFAADKPLRIESVQGISVSEVHVLKTAAALAANNNVTVHIVIETSRGGLRDAVSVNRLDDALVVRADRSRWEWPRDCVRAKLFVTLPAFADDGQPAAAVVLPALSVETGLGRLNIMDVGELALGDLHISMRNGVVQMRELGIQGSLHASTSNGRINATRLVMPVGSAQFVSTNAALSLQDIQAAAISASTTNGAIQAHDLRASDQIVLRTSNSPVAVHGIQAGHAVDIATGNGAIHGDLSSAEGPVGVSTTNAAVGVQISGISGSQLKTAHVQTTNAAANVDFAGVFGSFDVRTTNGRVSVMGMPQNLLKLKNQSSSHKIGSFGESSAGIISVASTNSQVKVAFAG